MNEYIVFGYNKPENEKFVIYEMGDLTGEEYQSRYQDGFDEFGGYGIEKFASLEDALNKYPNSRLVPLCKEYGGHQYSEETCPKCGTIFCWSCCERTNVHEGGKHESDFMLCPCCKTDIFDY